MLERFRDLGIALAGISVDPPEALNEISRELQLRFPLYSDQSRELLHAWELLKPNDQTGIAPPMALLVDAAPGGELRELLRIEEGIMRRVPPEQMLAAIQHGGLVKKQFVAKDLATWKMAMRNMTWRLRKRK